MTAMRKSDFSLLFLMCAIWAGSYFVTKSLLAFVDPVTLSFLRALLGGALIFAMGGYAMKGLSRSDIVVLSITGIFSISLFFVLLNIGLTSVSPGVASTLVYTQPVFVVALSPLVGETLSIRKVIGVILAFVGVTLIFLSSLMTFSLVIGVACVLGSSLSWTTSILLFKRWNTKATSRVVTTVQLLAGSVFVLPFFAVQKPFVDPTPIFWAYMAYVVVLATGFGYVIFWRVLTRMPASEATPYLFLVPLLATLFGSVIAMRAPVWNEAAGSLLVASGIIIVSR